jgi:hypothetical protein
MSGGRRIRIEEVLVYLGVEGHPLLGLLRKEGLFEGDELEAQEADDLRLAAVLMEELGVNAAGVDVALHLRRRLLALEVRTRVLIQALDEQRKKT